MTPKPLPADLSAWPKDPATVLGVSRGVDRKNLRRAYAARLRQFNPEHFPEHFRRIREAYEFILRQVESRAAYQPFDEAEPDAEAPLEFHPAADESIIDPPAGTPPVADNRPVAGHGARPAASIARWHDDLEALWDRAVARDASAYRALVEMEARFGGRRDLCLRLYWLRVAWPELDSQREACDWLIRGLRTAGLSGPLAELYRREIEDHPAEGLSERCTELLDCDAAPAPLADLVEWRWRAAGRLDQFEPIAEDLERLRARPDLAADEIWGRLLLSAVNELCWSPSPEIQSLCEAIWLEMDELPHLHTRYQQAMDRAETIRAVAAGWNLLRGARGTTAELLELVRLSVLRPADEVAPPALELLHRLLTDDRRLLAIFDRIHKASPATLAQVGQVIGLCGGFEPLGARSDAAQIRVMAQLEIESHYSNSYDALRPHLLQFCVAEQISPETLVRMPGIVLVRPESANSVLVRRISADAPLRLVYLAHRALQA